VHEINIAGNDKTWDEVIRRELVIQPGDVFSSNRLRRSLREVFNLGCGFCCVVAAGDEEQALTMLRAHYPEAKRIGQAVEGSREVACPDGWPGSAVS